MAAKTVLNYLERDSVIHKMTGTTKLAFFLLFTFASMITYNTWVLLVLFAVSLAAFKLSHIKYREVRFMMISCLYFWYSIIYLFSYLIRIREQLFMVPDMYCFIYSGAMM